MQDNHENSGGAHIGNKIMEIITALIILAFGAVVMYDSNRIGSGWDAEGPQSGSFPFYVGLLVVISAVVTLISAIRMDAKEAGEFAEHDQLKLVMAVLLPSIVYVVAIEFIGMYIASAAFIAVFMVWQGKFSVLKSVIVAVSVSIFFLVMFEIAFKIPLPKIFIDDALVGAIGQLSRLLGL